MSAVTKIILLERIEKLGKMGDVVSVKPGFARNFLLPQKKALRASKENIAYFDAQKKHLETENEKQKKEAEKIAKKLDGVKAPLIRQASESGNLFGSVNARDIAATISDTSGVAIQKNMVNLNQNIKIIGLIPIELILHPEVRVNVIINIARSPEEAGIQESTGRALIAGHEEIATEKKTAPEEEAKIVAESPPEEEANAEA